MKTQKKTEAQLDLNSIAVLAASKAFATTGGTVKLARDKVDPGTFHVSADVKIRGTVKVGENYEQRIVAKADPWALFAVALSKLNGVTVDSIVREALDEGLDLKAVKASAESAIAELKAPTVQKCRGKVTGSVNTLIVDVHVERGE